MGLPRQRLTRIAGYRIGGDQSGGTGTILQTRHELASFQLVELHLIPASQGCSAAWPHAAVFTTNRRAVCLPTLTSLQLLLRAAVADEAEPTRLPISGVGATGT